MPARVLPFLLSLVMVTHGHAAWRVAASENRSSGHGITHLEKRLRSDGHPREVTVELLVLDPTRTRLKVVPVAEGQSVADALGKSGALAGVNGGYFHADRRPLGIVVMEGRETHGLERSKLLSGVLEVTEKRARLLRRAEFKKTKALREALQAGPYLVDKGSVVAGLNARKPAARTVLLADRHGVTALALISPVTLAEAGQLLATPQLFPDLPPIERALNLDGGSSSALWVSPRIPLRSASSPEWKRVINAVGVFPKR